MLLGPPGTGKTHLATGLGIAAAHHGHRVLFATATDWVTRLTDAHRAGRLPARTDPAPPLRADHRRRGRLPTLRARRREPVLPARLLPLRTRLADPDQQPALQRLGRRLRRPSRRRRHDRPHRPPRRRHHPQRRQLPAPQPRHRHPAQHQNPRPGRLRTRRTGGLIFDRRIGLKFDRRRHPPGILAARNRERRGGSADRLLTPAGPRDQVRGRDWPTAWTHHDGPAGEPAPVPRDGAGRAYRKSGPGRPPARRRWTGSALVIRASSSVSQPPSPPPSGGRTSTTSTGAR